jgi:hypothetical protein
MLRVKDVISSTSPITRLLNIKNCTGKFITPFLFLFCRIWLVNCGLSIQNAKRKGQMGIKMKELSRIVQSGGYNEHPSAFPCFGPLIHQGAKPNSIPPCFAQMKGRKQSQTWDNK